MGFAIKEVLFFFLIFIFTLLYNTVLVLPYIDMNPPQQRGFKTAGCYYFNENLKKNAKRLEIKGYQMIGKALHNQSTSEWVLIPNPSALPYFLSSADLDLFFFFLFHHMIN